MNLYIASIKMWFKGFRENPERTITYTFESNKINVITGDASTGKSSLLGIIDYLLLSDNPTIVENFINENVEFYGMNIYIDGVSYIIIRKAPLSERASQDVYYKMGIGYPEPYHPTHSVGQLRVLFANTFNIPERHAKVNRQNATLTFRHFLPFNYLTEDIISSANVYFDIPFFVNKSFETFLDFALEYANGIKCNNEKEVASELEKVQKELSQYQQKHLNSQNEEKKYQEDLSSIFDDAMSLNLVSADNLFLRENADEMLKYVQKAISSYDKLIKDEEETNKLKNLRKKKDELQSKLSMFNSLVNEMDKQKKLGSKVEDSLRPITYIRKHMDEVISSPDTIELLDLLEKQLKQIKDKERIPSVLPPDFESRYQELKQEFKYCQNELMRLSGLRKTIGDPVWLNKALRIKYRLKDLKKPPKDTYQPSVEQDKLSHINSLKIQLRQIHQLPHDVKAILYPYINHYFQSDHGTISSYPGASMQYDDEGRRVLLLKDGEEYPVRNIGSKSNYMFLHLCFFLGLHKSFLDKKSKQVGSFLFIDQPSIPYYADKDILDNDDKKQLKKALRLLNDFMIEVINQEMQFQIILIEHAEESYWEDLESFHTVAVFSKTQNGGLIPKHIYE